jgi:hypothetical protein
MPICKYPVECDSLTITIPSCLSLTVSPIKWPVPSSDLLIVADNAKKYELQCMYVIFARHAGKHVPATVCKLRPYGGSSHVDVLRMCREPPTKMDKKKKRETKRSITTTVSNHRTLTIQTERKKEKKEKKEKRLLS